MFEVIVLTNRNVHEVAKKTGRAVDELEIMYYMAQRRNEMVVFTIATTEWRIPK